MKRLMIGFMLLGACICSLTLLAREDGHEKDRHFSLESIRGPYGLRFSGSIINASGFSGPITGTGQIVADGRGTFTGSETFNVTGTVCEGPINGTYTVNSDGTGTVSFGFTPGSGSSKSCPSGTSTLSHVLVDEGNEIWLSQTDANKVVSGEARKQ